ncbi:hypothetical protein [Lacinutrix chionoecetis]
MKPITFLLLFALLTSCSKNPETFIEHVDGYWEIESVTLANGAKKEYTVNLTVDFISVDDDLKGFRKKMSPKLDGTFEASNNAEALQLKIENDSLNLYYNTAYAKWKETVLFANTQQLKIINQNNDVYLYKRYNPIIVE